MTEAQTARLDEAREAMYEAVRLSNLHEFRPVITELEAAVREEQAVELAALRAVAQQAWEHVDELREAWRRRSGRSSIRSSAIRPPPDGAQS